MVVVDAEQGNQVLLHGDRDFHALQAEVAEQGRRRWIQPASLQAARRANLTLVWRGGHLRHPARLSQKGKSLGPGGDRIRG